MIKIIIIFLSATVISILAKAEKLDKEMLSYCVPVEKINFSPFREINDGKELAYLMLLKSYISTDSTEEGILSQYEFSPDGKVFTGRISAKSKWGDGRSLTAREAAFGIAKTLTFRLLGDRVRVVGTEDINQNGWLERKYKGIELIDDKTFKLTFKSEIKNLTGVVREALSTNSRHNRFWPLKLDHGEAPSDVEVMFKYPFFKQKDSVGMVVENQKVAIHEKKNCQNVDMSIFPEVFAEPLSMLVKLKSPNASAITAQTNTNRLSLTERMQIIAWLRDAFFKLPEDSGIQDVDSFFLEGETGYNKETKWERARVSSILPKKKIVIAYGTPIYKTFMEKALAKSKLKADLVYYPSNRLDVDVQLLSSGMIESRHVILQDILKWEHVEDFMAKAPMTKEILLKISDISASTIPPDTKILSEFEKISMQEYSLAPIARRFPTAFSRKKLPLCLAWNGKGELTFLAKNKCI